MRSRACAVIFANAPSSPSERSTATFLAVSPAFSAAGRALSARSDSFLAARSAISAHSPPLAAAGFLGSSWGAAGLSSRGVPLTARRRRRCVFFSLPSRSAIPSSVGTQYAPAGRWPPRARGGLATRGPACTSRAMPVHRERVDPIRTPAQLEVCHRRWLLPDDVGRAVALPRAARLWRGLIDLGVLDASSEAELDRLRLPAVGEGDHSDLPAAASAGALLAGSGTATTVSQVGFPQEGRRDPYQEEGPDPGYRDYTLYVVDSLRFLLLPLRPVGLFCGACGRCGTASHTPFGAAALLDVERTCPGCGARRDLGRDRARLRSGAIFLLEELCARAALSIELPRAPRDEELPDAAVAAVLREAFGGYDELADSEA